MLGFDCETLVIVPVKNISYQVTGASITKYSTYGNYYKEIFYSEKFASNIIRITRMYFVFIYNMRIFEMETQACYFIVLQIFLIKFYANNTNQLVRHTMFFIYGSSLESQFSVSSKTE